MRGFFGGCWEAGLPARRCHVFCADDLMISPSHRNRGLFTALMKGAFDDLAAGRDGFSFTPERGADDGARLPDHGLAEHRLDAPGGTRVERGRPPAASRRVPGEAAVLLAPRPGRGQPAPHRPGAIRPARFGRERANGGSVRLEREPRPEAMARLVERAGHDGRIRHLRDARYFGWRFRNPRHDYRFLYLASPSSTATWCSSATLSATTRPGSTSPTGKGSIFGHRPPCSGRRSTGGGFPGSATWTATLVRRRLPAPRRARGFATCRRRGPPPAGRVFWSGPSDWGAGRAMGARRARQLMDLASWDLRMLYSMYG